MTKNVTKSSRAEISNCIVSYFYLCVFSEVHVFLCYFVCVDAWSINKCAVCL